MHVNWDDLAQERVPADRKFTLEATDISLDAALARLLDPAALEIRNEGGLLEVAAMSNYRPRLVVYDVSEQVSLGFDAATLIRMIQRQTPGPWQDVAGDGGSVSIPHPTCCIVRADDKCHHAIADLLEDLRERLKDVADSRRAMESERGADDGTVAVRYYALVNEKRAAPVRETILDLIEPESWKGKGGDGLMRAVDRTLIIRQTLGVHRKIEKLLRELREAEEGT